METHVQRASLRCRLPAGSPPHDVPRRIAGALRRLSAFHFDRQMAHLGEREIVLLRDLAVEFDVPAAATEADIADRFGRSLSAELDRTWQGGRVVRFADRAAFAAAFLQALAAKDAHQWYFARLRRKHETPRRAARRVLHEYGDVLPSILARLHQERALGGVLALLWSVDHWALWVAGLGGHLDLPQLRSLLADVAPPTNTNTGGDDMADGEGTTNDDAPTAEIDLDAREWTALFDRVLTRAFDEVLEAQAAGDDPEAQAPETQRSRPDPNAFQEHDSDAPEGEGDLPESEDPLEQMAAVTAEILRRALTQEDVPLPAVDAEGSIADALAEFTQPGGTAGEDRGRHPDDGETDPDPAGSEGKPAAEFAAEHHPVVDAEVDSEAPRQTDPDEGQPEELAERLWRSIQRSVEQLRTSIEDATLAAEDLGRDLRSELDRPATPEEERAAAELARFAFAAPTRADSKAGARAPGTEPAAEAPPAETASPEASEPAVAGDAAFFWAQARQVLAGLGARGLDQVRKTAADWVVAWMPRGRSALDWQNPVALARTLAAAIRFLLADDAVQLDREVAVRRLDATGSALLTDLDWLDVPTLTAELRHIAATRSRPIGEPSSSTAAAPTLSPRLRALAAALRRAVKSCRADLEHVGVNPANSMRVYAALVAADSAWASDPTVSTWIPRALAAFADSGGLDDDWIQTWHRPTRTVSSPGPIHAKQDTRATPPEPRRRAAAAALGFRTPCAGLFLLLRAVGDLRLPTLLAELGLAPGDAASFLAAVGLRIGGTKRALRNDELDGGLRLWSGPECPEDRAGLRTAVAGVFEKSAATLHTALLQRVCSTRLAALTDLRVLCRDGLLVGFDANTSLPCFVSRSDDIAATVESWLTILEKATGREAATITSEPDILAVVRCAFADACALDPSEVEATAARLAHLEWLEALAPEDSESGVLAATTFTLIAAWGRWLRGFEHSSPGYLCTQFVNRDGRVRVRDDDLEITVATLPMDVVLDKAGYFEPFAGLPWLPRGGVSFRRMP